jgi:hypothetical protein
MWRLLKKLNNNLPYDPATLGVVYLNKRAEQVLPGGRGMGVAKVMYTRESKCKKCIHMKVNVKTIK